MDLHVSGSGDKLVTIIDVNGFTTPRLATLLDEQQVDCEGPDAVYLNAGTPLDPVLWSGPHIASGGRDMPALTIAKAAREAGVNIETVRFYERRGLIERPPKGEGYRVYSPDRVARIRFVKEAQQIGFSLAEIKELLALRADPNADCSAFQQQAMAKQQEVLRKIERLREIDAALETLIAACPGQGALQCCSIIDALNHRPRVPARAEESQANTTTRRSKE